MNKKSISAKELLLIFLCFAMGMGIRLFLMLSGDIQITDDMHFFELSVIQEKPATPVMTSGIAFVYTKSLSNILRFTGNRLSAVAWYHILLQAVSFFFLFWGCRLLFGKAAAFFESAVFAVSPWLIKGIFMVSPESFYLCWWSFLFFMIGIFAKKTRDKGWYLKKKDDLFLLLTGFLIGVICIWHNMGLLLLLFLAYTFFSSDETGNKKWEIMPILSVIIILMAGILLGGYAALVKYTGVTGMLVWEQFLWWKDCLFRFENGRLQDLEIWLPLELMITICAGAILEIVLKTVLMKKAEKQDTEREKFPAPEDSEMEEKKQIKYLENPLPLPKKHVKRTLDFEVDIKDDFDIDIKEDDDFDI